MVSVLPVYALSHESAVAFILVYSVLFSSLTVEVSWSAVDASEMRDGFIFGNLFAYFDFNLLDQGVLWTPFKLSNMSAKKNFRSFGFSAKFCSVDPVLHSFGKYSALVCVLLTCLYRRTDFFFENFTGEGVGVSHQNLLLSLSGTLLNCWSGCLLRAKDVWILIRSAGHLISQRSFSKNLLVVWRLRICLGLSLESFAFECVSVSEILSVRVDV